MAAIIPKVISMVVLGFFSFLLGMMPIWIVAKLGWHASSERASSMTTHFLSGTMCFGGGVLMGTGFLHLLPEVHEGFQHYFESRNIDSDVPVGIVVICSGFFLVYLIEEIVHLVSDSHAHDLSDISVHRTVSVRPCPVSREGPLAPCDFTPEEAICSETSKCQLDCDDKQFCRDINLVLQEDASSDSDNCYGTFGVNARKENCPQDVRKRAIKLDDTRSTSPSHHHHGLAVENSQCVGAPLRGLLVIFALSLHEMLEGLAVGLQRDGQDVWKLFAAVASHKFIISFCVGLELTMNGLGVLIHSIYILVFSLVTPAGIGIGIALTFNEENSSTVESLTSLILQGLACGTILYVAFFEILERERLKATIGLVQWSLLLLGFLAILGLQYSVGHDHSHIEAERTNSTGH